MTVRTPEQIWQLTVGDILNALEENRKLLTVLTGSVYPTLVRSESFLLRERYKSLTGTRCPL